MGNVDNGRRHILTDSQRLSRRLRGERLCGDGRAFGVIFFGDSLLGFFHGLDRTVLFIFNFLCSRTQSFARAGFVKNDRLVGAGCTYRPCLWRGNTHYWRGG
jgi:hypothetical protein